jgi:hypothetical protein
MIKNILLYFAIIIIGHGAVIYLSLDKIHSYADAKFEEGVKKGFKEGYKKYQKDFWIPAPFIAPEIKMKRISPDIQIEKFKG